jgi:hypothetical protein
MYNIIIPRKITELGLRKLYLIDNLTLKEIADVYEYKTVVPIRKKLKEFKIPLRTSKETCMLKYGVENPSQIKEVKEKKKQTNLKRRGVENPMQCKEIIKKGEQTRLKKLGVKYPLQSEEIQKKYKKTNLEKHGVEHPAQCEKVQGKMMETCLKNLGVENPSQAEEIKKKKKQTNLKRRNVEHPMKCKEIVEKGKKTCLKNLGVKNPNQKHIKNYEIYNDKKLFQEWIIKTYNKLERKLTTGDLNNYFNLSKTTMTAPNKLRELPEQYTKYYKINESYFESLIEDWLKSNNIAYIRNKYYDFLRNKNENMMQLDFYIPNKRIAIEMNDNWSHNPEFMIKKGMSVDEAVNYEQIKSDLCAKQNIQLIHIYEKDLDNLDVILNNILT